MFHHVVASIDLQLFKLFDTDTHEMTNWLKYSKITCAKGHLRVADSCPLTTLLIQPVKIGWVVSDASNKGHLSTKATFIIPRGWSLLTVYELLKYIQ